MLLGEEPISETEEGAGEGQAKTLAFESNEHALKERLVFDEKELW